MNVTLVYPSIKQSGFDSLGKTSGSCYINHGLSSLAACLIQEGHRVSLLDLRDMRGWRQVEQWIRNDPSLDYGIQMATLDFHEAIKTAGLIRKLKPRANIVAGGPHASVAPEKVAEVPYFDKILVGEGEVTYPDLLVNPKKYGRIVQCERPDLDSLPYENREIFNMKKILKAKSPYTGKQFFPMPFINVISGRGCIWRCGFCKPVEDLIFGKFRMRSLEHFMGEIEMLQKKYAFRTLMIDDDSFTLFPNYTQSFCELYKKKIHKSFYFQSRADFIVNHPDMMKQIKNAGGDTVFIGFEVGTQRILDLIHKDTTVEQNFEAAEICHKLGFKIWANYMVGLPTETKGEMQSTFDMVKKIKPEYRSGAFFTPMVGTHLYDYCKKHDLLLSEDPAVLGSRNPSVAKIKGLDLKWMNQQMNPKGKLWRRIAKKTLGTLLLRRENV
jgi:anaerobic magnesium-protoporphyrin IX monomethyl ester cyclase